MFNILFAIHIVFIIGIPSYYRRIKKMLSNYFRNIKGVYNFNLFLLPEVKSGIWKKGYV